MSKGIVIICKAKRQLNIAYHITFIVYRSSCFLYPYFFYCMEIWGAAADLHLQQIIKLNG